jgi:hypothetical protein
MDSPDPERMRISHDERDAVSAQLRDALDAGRLDLGEFDQRTRDLYTAQTYGDVARLLEDLPAANLPMPRPAAAPEPKASPEERSNTMGHIALGMGVASFASFMPFSVLAIVFGAIGLDRYKKGESDNRGYALAGLILGLVSIPAWIVFFIVGLMFWF